MRVTAHSRRLPAHWRCFGHEGDEPSASQPILRCKQGALRTTAACNSLARKGKHAPGQKRKNYPQQALAPLCHCIPTPLAAVLAKLADLLQDRHRLPERRSQWCGSAPRCSASAEQHAIRMERQTTTQLHLPTTQTRRKDFTTEGLRASHPGRTNQRIFDARRDVGTRTSSQDSKEQEVAQHGRGCTQVATSTRREGTHPGPETARTDCKLASEHDAALNTLRHSGHDQRCNLKARPAQ